VDFLPTVCEITGLAGSSDRKIDGASIVSVLSGGKVNRNTPLYWHFNQAAGGPHIALRLGNWKILATFDKPAQAGTVLNEQTEGDFKSAEPIEFQLYNLRDDIGETRDLAANQPEKFNEMKALLLAKYHEVRAESPTWPTWTPPVPPGKKKK
jgi:arylsulfatase A